MSDLGSFLPAFRRLAYLESLFEWLDEALEASGHSNFVGYPEIPRNLIRALQNLGQEIASVRLLKYCVHLEDLNSKIAAIRPDDDSENSARRAMELLMDDLPRARVEFRAARRECLTSTVAWLLGVAAVILAASYLYELGKALARMFYDPNFY